MQSVTAEEMHAMVAQINDYHAKILFLVDYLYQHGLLEDGCFTFPDGDTWEAKR